MNEDEQNDYRELLLNRVRVDTTIEQRIKRLGEIHQIRMNDALEFGLRFKLAEKGVLDDYPSNILLSNIGKLQQQLEIANNRIAELELETMGKVEGHE